jgi:hypothetical protein
MDAEQLAIALKKLVASRKKHPLHGWSQFYDVMAEIEGYGYLQKIGASSVKFITDGGCPDLEGILPNNELIIEEVKCIHPSDEENIYLLDSAEEREARAVGDEIPCGLKEKVYTWVIKAQGQLLRYKSDQNARRIIYFIIQPDLGVKLNDNLWGELDQFMERVKVIVKSCRIDLVYQIKW